MSSNSNSRFYNRVSFKLGAAYVTLFILSTGLIFTVNFFLLAHSLEQHDKDLVDESFDHYSLVYNTSGLKGLQREVDNEDSQAELNALLLRVQNPTTGEILFYHGPKDIAEYDAKTIDAKLKSALPTHGIIRIPSKDDNEDVLEVMQQTTSDGLLIQVGKNSEDREDFLDRFRDSFLMIALPCLIIGLAGAFVLVTRVLKPVKELIATIHKIETGETDAKAAESEGQDELSELSRLFNRAWAKNQRLMKGMRQSLDMVAHDLRTPLTRVRGYAEEARKQTDLAQKNASIEEAILNLDETTKLLDLMLDISEGDSGAFALQKEKLSVRTLLGSIKDLYSIIAEDRQMEIHLQVERDFNISADKRLKQAIANLLDNALKYSHAGSVISLLAWTEGTNGVFEVRDQGPGIDKSDHEKIWQRFYRGTHSTWQPGLGLGLSLVASIVHAHEGKVEIAGSDSSGTTFRITLPLARD